MYSLGINFLNKLSFTRKFQVILFTLLLPIIYASVIIYLENSNKIELIANRITGLETANHLKPLRILAGKHRGSSAQFLEGSEKVEGAIRLLEQEMDQAFVAAETNLNTPFYSDKSRQVLAQIKQNWANSTLNSIKGKSSLHSFDQHTAWVKEVDSLIHDIATQSGLNRDLSVTTQKLMSITVFSTPRLQEQLGQLRAIGSAVATRGEFDSRSFVLANTLFNEIESTILEIEYDFSILKEISASYTPSELQQARAGIQRFRKITNDQLLKPSSPTVSGSDYYAAGTEAIRHATELLKTINTVYQNELLSNEQQMIKDMVLSLGSFFLLFLISGYLFICLRITVDENARITQKMAIDLEDGRLNQTYYSNSQDELGNTIQALTTSYAKLRSIVSKVRNHSETLSSSSTTLSNVSNEVNTLGEEQKNRVAIISTAATELAATAQEVSSHCELAASKMQESQKQASLGASHSHSSADVIRTLANNVRNAGNEIGELAQQAASISTVIDVIKAIAEQTNLLALNAAIEAARAGEQGRGFAVVADEVRTLATRTQESTNEIENTISSLQQVAEKAVLAMNTSCEQASQSETEATTTGEVLSTIENSINEVSSLIEQVATAGVQQAGAANEIAQNIQAVDDASNDLLIKSQNMSSIAKEVGHDSLELDKQMQSFTV